LLLGFSVFIFSTLPEEKNSHFATPSTRLLEIRRQMVEVELVQDFHPERGKEDSTNLRHLSNRFICDRNLIVIFTSRVISAQLQI